MQDKQLQMFSAFHSEVGFHTLKEIFLARKYTTFWTTVILVFYTYKETKAERK
jgi:hypothetical protein